MDPVNSKETIRLIPFSTIRQKMAERKIVDSFVNPDKQHLATYDNTIFTFVDENGRNYDVEVYYYEDALMIMPPRRA